MRTQASTQRGVATIAGVLVLLALVALALLHSEQHAAAERHASESHVRRTRDAQVASAGLDWALAQLNEPRFAQARCAASDPTRIRFRQRALQEAKLHAQCGIDAYGALECRCSPEGMGEPSDALAASFRLTLQRSASATQARVDAAAVGCGPPAARCADVPMEMPKEAAGQTHARSASTFALLAVPRTPPRAALVAAGEAHVGTQATITNQDLDSAGITVAAAAAVSVAAEQLGTLPGRPSAASVVESDARLVELATNGSGAASFWQQFLGIDMAALRAHASTRLVCSPLDPNCPAQALKCSLPIECGRAAVAALNEGHSVVWLDAPALLPLPTLAADVATQNAPVLVVATAPLQLDGPRRIHALVLLDFADASLHGAAGVELHGAVVASRRVAIEGPLALRYDPLALASLGALAGRFVTVPGSWRDFH